MMTRFKWLISGALLTVVGISYVSYSMQVRRQAEAELAAENARLAIEAKEAAAESARLKAETLRLAAEKERLRKESERLEKERAELAVFVERLNVENRVAQIDVLQQHRDDSGRVIQTVIRLTEMGRDGEPMTPQVFGVPGDTPHFDALIIKFLDDYVARGDQLRGRSLALFRRVYGEVQAPEDGYWLGQPGTVPDIYRLSSEPSAFEQGLWSEFWTYARDPRKAREAGVRVAQGEAVYAPMETGDRWLLSLEADGGLNLQKIESPDGVAGEPAASLEGDR